MSTEEKGIVPTLNTQRCKKRRDKKKENYKKSDALHKKHYRLMMKLNDSEKCKGKKEKDKLRKCAERKRNKLELEALETPSTIPQTTIASSLVNQVRSNTG